MYEIFDNLCAINGVTAYRVGKETGIATSTFTDWKKGKSTPKQDKLMKIADYFGVSLEYLMTGKELQLDYLYTDENYRHGCFPWHLNAYLYWNIHLSILREIKKYDNAAVDEMMDKSREQYRNAKEVINVS